MQDNPSFGGAEAGGVIELKGDGSPVLPSRTPKHTRRRHDAELSQGPEQLVALLQAHLETGQWGPVVHIVHLVKFMAQCKPYMVKQLAAAGAPRALMAVMRGILEGDEGPDATELVMAEASELLLCLVESDQAECVADVLTADSVTVLFRALSSPRVGTQARQHVARLLRHFVASGPAWRGPLLAHGGLEGLPKALQDPVAACDLLFMQEVLWALVGLVDAALAGGGEVQNPNAILGILVPLLQLLQLSQLSHLSHIAALVVRVLHVLAAGDDHSKQFLGEAGVINMLVDAVRTERAAELAAAAEFGSGDGSGSWSAAAAPSLNRARTSEPSSERLALSGLTPLRNPSVDGNGPWSPAGMVSGPSASRTVHSHGRESTSGLAAPLGLRVSSWDRLMVALLLREILAHVGMVCDTPKAGAGPAHGQGYPTLTCSGLAIMGALLPVLVDGHTSTVNRLCIVKESVVAIKVLVSDSEDNQKRAAQAGAVPILLHLVSQGDVTLAWQSADALSNLATDKYANDMVNQGVVEEITHLLQEAGDALHLMTVRKQLEDHQLHGAVPSLPTPHAAYAHKARHKRSGAGGQPRVQLVGRQRLSFAMSNCMYTTHSTYSMCDYCVPSACLRALLRLLGSCIGGHRAPSVEPGASRHSSAQSLGQVTQPSDKQLPARTAAGRFVSSGGLYALFLLLHHELSGSHHSKMVSSLISLLNLVLDTGLDIQDEVRKVGGLALLVALLDSLTHSQGITDIYQLRVQVCRALRRLVEGNSANKLLVRERDLIPLLASLLQSSLDPDSSEVLDDKEQVTTSALDLLSACIADSPGSQEALITAGGLRLLNDMLTGATKPPPTPVGKTPPGPPKLKGSPEVLSSVVRAKALLLPGSAPAQLALLGSPALSVLVQFAEQQPTSTLAQNVVFLACQLMHSHVNGKAHASASGLLGLLVKMIHTPPWTAHVASASQGLYTMCVGDIDMQNEVVAQKGLVAIEVLVRESGVWRVHALWLLCCLMHGNSYVKSEARQTPGLVRSLMAVLKKHAVGGQQDLAIAAAHALAQLCQSNHANQELLADEGGLETVTDMLQAALQQAPERTGSGKAGLPPIPGSPATNGSPGGAEATAAALAASSELGELSVAALYPGVLDAGLRLLGAMLEFNATNQKLVRESGCLGLVAELLLRAGEIRDFGVLRRAFLLPAVSAACAAVARAAQDCEENQQRLVTGHEDLAPALFRLLSVDEPYVALDAAQALEHMVIRSDLVHDQREDRPEFEADAIRTLVTALHSRGSGTRASGSGAAGASVTQGVPGAPGGASVAGFWAQGLSLGGGERSAYGAGPAPGTATATSVREAAAVLLAIVKAAQSVQPATPSLETATSSHTATSTLGTPGVNSPAAAANDAAAAKTSTFSRLFTWRSATTPTTTKPTTDTDPSNQSASSQQQQQAPATSEGASGRAGASGAGDDAGDASSLAEDDDSVLGTRGGSTGPPSPTATQGGEGAQGGPEITPAPPLDASVPGQPTAAQTLPPPKSPEPLNLDHTNGLATLKSLQDPTPSHMAAEDWNRLAGQSASAFKPVAALISEGPWRQVKMHLSWLLFLLAVRSQANRDLLAKLERSVVTPIANQLANAESFYASAEAAEAVAAAATSQVNPTLPVSTPAHGRTNSWQLNPPIPPALPVSTPPSSTLPSPRQPSSTTSQPPVSHPAPDSTSRRSSNAGQSAAQSPAQLLASSPHPTTQSSPMLPVSGSAVPRASSRVDLNGSDDDELDFIKREAEMLAGIGNKAG